MEVGNLLARGLGNDDAHTIIGIIGGKGKIGTKATSGTASALTSATAFRVTFVNTTGAVIAVAYTDEPANEVYLPDQSGFSFSVSSNANELQIRTPGGEVATLRYVIERF